MMGRLGFGIRPPLQFAYPLLHLLTRLERHYELLWDKDFIAGPWIASLASRPFFHFKYAKISELDPPILDQRSDDCIKGLLHNLLGLELCQPNILGDRFDDLFLGHGTALLSQCPAG
jgi:hypothetical protein